MDLKSLTREDIDKMTLEEKREFVRQLIHNQDSSIRAVLFDASTGEHLSLQELIERKGEEEVVEMLVEGFSNSNAMAETISGDKIREALVRLQRGEATDEDKRLLYMVKEASRHSPMRDIGTHLTSIILDFICYYQERHNIPISSFDLDTIIGIIQTVNVIHNPAFETYKFHGSMPNEILDVTDSIADDMLTTWEATLTSPYSTEMKYLAVLSLVRKLSEQLNAPLLKAEQLADILDFDLSEIKGVIEEERKEEAEQNHENNTCGATCQPVVHDATNGSNTAGDENTDMKNLMKGN